MTEPTSRRWVPDAGKFAARLALIRHYMGWNLKEAALACGFPPGSWREWELHNREPRGLVDIAARIAERTGVDKYWLMTGEVYPQPPPHPHDGPSSPLRTASNPPGRDSAHESDQTHVWSDRIPA
jgi:transcriptional regulator with XRE-family HTH domain